MWEIVTTQPCQGVWKECKHVWPARPHDRGQAGAGSPRTLLLSDLRSYHPVTPPHSGGGYKLISVWGFLNGGDPHSSVVFLSSCRQNWQTFLPWCSTEILPPRSSWSRYLTRRQLSCTANQEQWLWSQTRRSHTYHGVLNIPEEVQPWVSNSCIHPSPPKYEFPAKASEKKFIFWSS